MTRQLTRALTLGASWLVLLVVALAVALPGAARAASPTNMLLGFDDDTLFQSTTGPVRDIFLQRVLKTGGTVVRLEAFWDIISPYRPRRDFRAADPGDPQYDFASLDSAVQAASAHHQRILLLLRDAPLWAERSDIPPNFQYPGSWWPNAAKFGAFAHAVAARYSGHFRAHGQVLPAVRYYQAWNEPNLPYYLSPQWGSLNGRVVPLGPAIYRTLLNAMYAGVKAVSRRDVVVSAGTAPYGDPPASGQGRMRPVTFLESLFCLDAALRALPCANPPHLDVLDHHPYSLSPQHHANNAGDISVTDIDRIRRVLDAARRTHRVLPDTPKPVWVTEVAWSDVQPYSLPTQARALSEALYLLWRQGVAVVLWFQFRDIPGYQNSFKGTGLYTVEGHPKPAAHAFYFPFVAFPGKRSTYAIWGKAPSSGLVAVQLLTRRGWRNILTIAPGPGGYFLAERKLRRHEQLRAVEGRHVSLVWSTTGGL